ncbi:MAG: FAD-dependent oxidoreductase [Myxococcales bacterium]|nr:FAD-dependent oxidoreductase [Myxococcales bacterium]
MAIVGGGIAGLTLAWLLDHVCDVTLFEKARVLGGHIETVEVDLAGERHAVDLGAQLFNRRVHPTFMALLDVLGVADPPRASAGSLVTREMGTTLADHGAALPRFVSPLFRDGRLWPTVAPWNAAGQAAFLSLALAAPKLNQADWRLTLDEWLRTVRGLTTEGRERIVLPWLSALAGCSIEEARAFSARAGAAIPARAIPANPLEPYSWSHVARGLGSVVALLERSCTHLRVRRGARVVSVRVVEGGLAVRAEGSPELVVDHVVLAAPPHATAALVADMPGRADLAAVLGGFRYFQSRLLIHTDPVYMHPDRRYWSAYNATTRETYCEGSIWYGAIRDKLPSGATADIFKSWATNRDKQPRALVAEKEYRHPLLDPAFFRGQAALERAQGRGNLWFAGSYCRDVDLQETALQSALRVADSIAASAPNVMRLRAAATRAAIERRRARPAIEEAQAMLTGVLGPLFGRGKRVSST